MTAPTTNTPLLDRIQARTGAPAPERPAAWRPRWLRSREDAIADRERRGGSRYEAVADLTGSSVL